MKFNLADQRFHVITFDADGRVTGEAANITATQSIDGGAYEPLNDVNPTEIGTTGEYFFELTQAETAGHALSFTPVCSTSGVQVLGVPSNVIYTFDGGASLVGDYTLTVTVTDADSGDPIEGATVTLSRTGQRGAKLTDASGVAVVGLDAATWSWIVRAAGYEDRTGTIAISGNAVLSVEMDGIVVAVPSSPDKSMLNVLCLDESGDPEPDVAIDIRIVTVPSGDLNTAYKGVKQTAISNSEGVASLEAIKGAVYEYKRGKADEWSRVTIGSGSTTNVSSFIGSP
jgi:hypothetical protein